jgi:uracil permease
MQVMPEEILPVLPTILFSLQMMMACFSAVVLVPLIVGLPPSTALFSAGIGTIIYLICTQFKCPMMLGSSFAFIPALISTSQTFGWGATSIAVIASGLFYALISVLLSRIPPIKTTKGDISWFDYIFPPIVIGPVIVTIGMSLLPGTITAAFGGGDSYNVWNIIVGLFTFAVIALVSTKSKSYFKAIPVLTGVIVGYIFVVLLTKLGIKTDYAGINAVKEAPYFILPFGPGMGQYSFNITAIITFLIVSLATVVEHIGDNYTISSIVGREFYKDPGLHRTILGDGLASAFAGLVGSVPNTSYGECSATQALSKIHSIMVIIGASIVAVVLSFFGKFSALITTIPWSVLNGACLALYGMIAASGFRRMVEANIDFNHTRNLLISSVILTIGIGGVLLKIGQFQLSGVALATIIGIALNLILPKEKD